MGRLLALLPSAAAVPLTREGLHRGWPGVWTSEGQARLWLAEQGGPEAVAAAVRENCLSAVTEDYGNATQTVFRAVLFRAEGARGPASLGLVREGTDPAEALAALLRRPVQVLAEYGAEAAA